MSVSLRGRLRTRLFGVTPEQTSFAALGFPVDRPEVATELQHIPQTFVAGYHAALECREVDSLCDAIEAEHPIERVGFAFEGAGMGLGLRDMLNPVGGRMLLELLEGRGSAHTYMVHIGAGWAMARVPFRMSWTFRRLHPLYRWLTFEGYGFHEGFFHSRTTLELALRPSRIRGYGRRAFDQGVGRSLWFSQMASVERIATVIRGFAAERQQDLWAGVGLAATYAGGVPPDEAIRVFELAGPHRAAAAQGSLFAVTARRRAGNPSAHSSAVAEVIWGQSLAELITEVQTQGDLIRDDGSGAGFEGWRQSLIARFDMQTGAK